MGWSIKKLGEVCQIKPPKEEARHKLSDTDLVSFVPISDLGIQSKNLTNGVEFGSSEYIVFRSKGTIEPEYIFYFLSKDSFRTFGARVITGAIGHKRVPKYFIENHQIILPPLSEQKRIVAILDEAFEGIDRARTKGCRR